jgi:hypothetical protein
MLRELVELAPTEFPGGWTLAGEHLPRQTKVQGSIDERVAELAALASRTSTMRSG